MIENVKLSTNYRSKCVRALQADGEYFTNKFLTNEPKNQSMKEITHDLMSHVCCQYNRWERCIADHSIAKCGPESANIIPYLIHSTSFNLVKDVCPQYRYNPANVEQCPPEIVYAPADFVPKGYGSNSLLSHAFSYLCPNVGWGLGNKDF